MRAHAVPADTPLRRFRAWARQRPFVGGLLVVLSGVELFCSGQLDLGNIRLQFGIEGLQATVIPVALVVLGLLGALSPGQRLFAGIMSLVLAVYSLIGVNLGGFVLGMLLGVVGGVLVVAWMPVTSAATSDGAPSAEPRADLAARTGDAPEGVG